METVRSLPPELQALIDEYNKLMEEGGYNKPYIETAFRSSNGSSTYGADGALQGRDFFIENDETYVPSDLNYDEWRARDKRIKDLNNEVFYLARKLINEGKIEIIPAENEGLARRGMYAYNKVKESDTGKTIYTSSSAPLLRKYRSIPGSEAIKPMRPIKAGLDQKERLSKELQQPTPIDMPKIDKELIMRSNQGMSTQQEPGYYMIKEKGKRSRMRPVEYEELQYYRNQNRRRQ